MRDVCNWKWINIIWRSCMVSMRNMLYNDEKIVTLIGRATEVEFSEIERKVMRAIFEIFIFILRKQWKPGETCITDFEKAFANMHDELYFGINFNDICKSWCFIVLKQSSSKSFGSWKIIILTYSLAFSFKIQKFLINSFHLILKFNFYKIAQNPRLAF